MDKFHLASDGHPRGRSTERVSSPGPYEQYFSRSASSMPSEGNSSHSRRKPRKLILCFDGTGNKFQGDDSDSNILKLFRMLDRTAPDQHHYYQPGIGTYVVSNTLGHKSTYERFKSWYTKAKDSAIGSSFDHHVVGGYRFLMRFHQPGDEIYIFGFSRGAYTAKFLAEMLDFCGILEAGCDELVSFAWKAFAALQSQRDNDTEEGLRKRREMYTFMKGFRETFSRPVRRIRFLGLFDTVNSVPRFETAWMERSKFPYTAKTSAKVIRHAVSIDERRAKFRQDLIYQSDVIKTKKKEEKPVKAHHHQAKMHDIHAKYRRRPSTAAVPKVENRGRRPTLVVPEDPAPYRARSRSSRTHHTGASARNLATQDGRSDVSVAPYPHADDVDDLADSEDENDQDIDEVWFSGGHGDIGGGWDTIPDSKPASHIPLVWMVHEAMKAGLPFDKDKVRELGCMDCDDEIEDALAAETQHRQQQQQQQQQDHGDNKDDQGDPRLGGVPDIMVRAPSSSTPKLFQGHMFSHDENPDSGSGGEDSSSHNDHHRHPAKTFKSMLSRCQTARIHDSLSYNCGLGRTTVLGWKLMEFLPLRRMDLQANGSWKPIRWPLPCGEVRDIPDNVRVHGSVIRRMQLDKTYRPGNLIIGGGGRGVRFAKADEYCPEDWVCVAGEGDPVTEVWIKRKVVDGRGES